VVLDPLTEQATHLVVKTKRFPHAQYLVSLDYVTEATSRSIQLRCTQRELTTMEPFVEEEFVPVTVPQYGDPFMSRPLVFPEAGFLEVEHEQIPPGELAVRRGTQVKAKDGAVGSVDEFLINPSNGHISHLVLREGHLWGQKEVTIPVSHIERIEEEAVYLNLTRHDVEKLPAIPIRRKWL
jgi:hypothetical protein